MLRSHFFYKFFKYKKDRSQEIVKYNSSESFDVTKNINSRILEIDTKIAECSTSLIEAQIVRLRSNFSNPNNFIEKLGKNVYKTKLKDSINWYEKQIKEVKRTLLKPPPKDWK